MNKKILRLKEANKGVLPAFTFPGGYEMFYVDGNGGVLCADCANEALEDFPQFQPQEYGYLEEGYVYCDQCSKFMGYETRED